MSDLLPFLGLGFHHVVSLGALDHILFLLALAAIYRPADWRAAAWVVTAFTAGHSVTLALAVTGAVTLPTPAIEFLIPVTIVVTGIGNLVLPEPSPSRPQRFRPLLAAAFGLVHGAGFANYLKALFLTDVAVPLFGFNVGIELGQLVVLTASFVALTAVDAILRRPAGGRAFRVRAVTVSAVVTAAAVRLAVERLPW
jgi:hypothetical protein